MIFLKFIIETKNIMMLSEINQLPKSSKGLTRQRSCCPWCNKTNSCQNVTTVLDCMHNNLHFCSLLFLLCSVLELYSFCLCTIPGPQSKKFFSVDGIEVPDMQERQQIFIFLYFNVNCPVIVYQLGILLPFFYYFSVSQDKNNEVS